MACRRQPFKTDAVSLARRMRSDPRPQFFARAMICHKTVSLAWIKQSQHAQVCDGKQPDGDPNDLLYFHQKHVCSAGNGIGSTSRNRSEFDVSFESPVAVD